MSYAIGLIATIVLGLIWWTPVIVASKRQGANYGAVFTLTALAPFTLGITWIIALVKSFSSLQTVRVIHTPADPSDWTTSITRIPAQSNDD